MASHRLAQKLATSAYFYAPEARAKNPNMKKDLQNLATPPAGAAAGYQPDYSGKEILRKVSIAMFAVKTHRCGAPTGYRSCICHENNHLLPNREILEEIGGHGCLHTTNSCEFAEPVKK